MRLPCHYEIISSLHSFCWLLHHSGSCYWSSFIAGRFDCFLLKLSILFVMPVPMDLETTYSFRKVNPAQNTQCYCLIPLDFNEEIGLAHSHFYRSKMESPATHFRTSLADTLYVMFCKVCRTISTKSRRFIHCQNLRLHGDWQAVHIFSIGNRQVDVQCQPNASDVARESRSIVGYSPRLREITMCNFQIC